MKDRPVRRSAFLFFFDWFKKTLKIMQVCKFDDKNEEFLIREYFKNFVRFYADSYAVQFVDNGRHWKTKHKIFSDKLIKAHLDRTYAVAAAAAYTPQYYFLDFDFGPNEVGGINNRRVNEAISRLNLSDGQFSLMTSPRYKETGNCHIALKLEYEGYAVPIRKGYRALQATVGDLCEIYPQVNKKFRLPLGSGQYLVEDGIILSYLNWQSALNFLLKNEVLPVESFADPNVVFHTRPINFYGTKKEHPYDKDCLELLEKGLISYSTRFESQWKLICYYQHRGISREENIKKVIHWIENNHNGFSTSINRSDWRTVYGEVTRQVKSAYSDRSNRKNNRYKGKLPDAPDGFTEYDIAWISSIFPGDIVRQNKLSRLLLYCRSNNRQWFDWMYIPFHEWYKIAGTRTYHKFIYELEDLGIIESDWHYRHVEDIPDASYSRKFKIAIPSKNGSLINKKSFPVQNYLDALLVKFQGNVADISGFTKIKRQRIYEYLDRNSDLDK